MLKCICMYLQCICTCKYIFFFINRVMTTFINNISLMYLRICNVLHSYIYMRFFFFLLLDIKSRGGWEMRTSSEKKKKKFFPYIGYISCKYCKYSKYTASERQLSAVLANTLANTLAYEWYNDSEIWEGSSA